MDPNYLDLLQCLNADKVRYLVIGGYAVILYTEPRYTKDLDIWIEASLPNAKRTLKALAAFGAPIDNLTAAELAKPGLIYVFGVPPLRVDVLNKASGVSFAAAWRDRTRAHIEGVKTPFISRRHLILQKSATARPQDRADLLNLKAGVKKGL